MPKQGWIKFYRDIEYNFLHPLNTNRKFTEYEALIDLLMGASHQNTQRYVKNELIDIPQNCLLTTRVLLADRWNWDRKRVSSFFTLLKQQNIISFKKVNNKRIKSWTLLKVKIDNVFGGTFAKNPPPHAPPECPPNPPQYKNEKNVKNEKKASFNFSSANSLKPSNDKGFMKYAQ